MRWGRVGEFLINLLITLLFLLAIWVICVLALDPDAGERLQ